MLDLFAVGGSLSRFTVRSASPWCHDDLHLWNTNSSAGYKMPAGELSILLRICRFWDWLDIKRPCWKFGHDVHVGCDTPSWQYTINFNAKQDFIRYHNAEPWYYACYIICAAKSGTRRNNSVHSTQLSLIALCARWEILLRSTHLDVSQICRKG
jgi:hypothetical protein